MSLYTTSELAKKCNVSVRTIQYYDKKEKLKKMEAVLGNHTPRMRKLTCPSCKRKIWSLEVYKKRG